MFSRYRCIIGQKVVISMERLLKRLDERLSIHSILYEEDRIEVNARLSSVGASCPQCACYSSRRHGTYIRTWMDIPEGGTAVSVRLSMPKWFCDNDTCGQKVFAERLQWLPVYQRRSARLDAQIRSLAFSLSALETEKICSSFGIRISHDTVLRLVYHTEVAIGTSPFCRDR